MFFASATLTSEVYGLEKVAICTDEKDEDFEDNSTEQEYKLLRVWYKRPISEAIMMTATYRLPLNFSCNGTNYTLLEYICTDDERYYNRFRENHVTQKIYVPKSTVVYIYRDRCRCTSCYDDYGYGSIESVCGIFRTKKEPHKKVEIDVKHCKHCGKFFIDKQSLEQYERRYGQLEIDKVYSDYSFLSSYTTNEYEYKKDTVLSRNGYYTYVDRYNRRRILEDLVDSGVSSKAEIADILTRFIHDRGARCPEAASVWQSDLNYINDYKIKSERVVKFVHD